MSKRSQQNNILDRTINNFMDIVEVCPDFSPNRMIRYFDLYVPVWYLPVFNNNFESFNFMIEKGANLKLKDAQGKYFVHYFWSDNRITDVQFYEKIILNGINIEEGIHLARLHITPFETWFTNQDYEADEYTVVNGQLRSIPETTEKIEKFVHNIEILLNVGYDPKLITSTDPIFKIFLQQNLNKLVQQSFECTVRRAICRNNIDIQKLPENFLRGTLKLNIEDFRLNLP